MCFSSPKMPDMPPPPAPPPPAPTPSATKVQPATTTRSDSARRAAQGLSKYRISRSMGGTVDKGVRRAEPGKTSSMSIY